MTKVALLTTTALTLLMTSLVAQAADLPRQTSYQQPVVVAPMFTWTGFYVGGNIGGAWVNGDVSSNFGSVWSTSNTVFIGGGQVGYNYQMGSFVLGAEWDFDFTSGKKSSGFVTTVPYGSVEAIANWNWITTVAARFGYAADRALFYGKVGAGWSKTSLTLQNLAGATLAGSSNNTNSGLLLGAGIEYAFTPNWTGKIEYNYLNLADRTFTVTGTNTVSVSPNIQMIKVGGNYKF